MRCVALLFLLFAPSAWADDPIAYTCYYCTPAEMEHVALQQGLGEHYVYDAARVDITGFTVTAQGNQLRAVSFTPAAWIRTQFEAMLAAYDTDRDETIHVFSNTYLHAPGSSHGRSMTVLWGHHLGGLNPDRETGREIVRRHLSDQPGLAYLSADVQEGRVLRFWFERDDAKPLLARLNFTSRPGYLRSLGNATFYFDRGTRRWEYLASEGISSRAVPDSAEDIVGPDGSESYSFPVYTSAGDELPAFLQWLDWAGIPVTGEVTPDSSVTFTCRKTNGHIACERR